VHDEDQAALRPDFKISVLAELEAGKPLAQIAAIMASIRVFLAMEAELAKTEKAFMGNGTSTKIRRRLQNWRDFWARLMLKLTF
jgi:hypothetical protein